MTRSEEFIQKYRKKLSDGVDYFNPDTSLMRKEDFDKAKCKMLLILPTPHVVKTVSSTVAAINDYIIEHCPGTFLDIAYMPDGSDIKLYDDNNMPYAIGNITHRDASHFDIVGFSISVLSEIVTAPVIMKSFERCDKPIPLFWSDRKDMKLGEVPLIYAGGITAVCGDVMFGEVPGLGQAFIDFMYLGDVEKTDHLISRYISARDNGVVTRAQSDHDVPGYPHTDLPDFQETLSASTIQEYINTLFDLKNIYQPQAYKVEYLPNNLVKSNKKINPYAQDFVVPYYPHELSKSLSIGRAVINGNGDNSGTTQTQVSEGCSAGGACSFCSEGNYTGGWVEKEKDQILWEIREAKKYSAGYKFKPYSFNCNYLTDYKGMLYEFLQKYPKVTFINMRMEELGRDVDALHMMKLVGSNRISAPMEGISPRIQNNLLNKCLSEESLNNFMDDMVHAKMTDIKVGGIFTGYEEDEDFQWICDFVDHFKQRANKEGGNFPFRLKCTPLVHYPLTPIEYLERKSAKRSYNGEHWLTDEWYEKFREHQVFFKVNGFRYSTFLEQSFVDLGRSLTPLIYKHFIKELAPIYSLRSCATDEFIADLKSFIKDPDAFFGDRDPEHYISPCHRIHIELMGSYIPRARRLLRHKREGNIFANEPDVRCLKTYEGAKVKCYHTCIVNDPIKVYNDVELDSDNNLQGDLCFNMTGCQRCPDNETRKKRLARPVPQTKNSEDIQACPRLPQVQKLRFVLNRLPEYDVLNPNNTAHTFLTKFLQKSDILLDAYHSMNVHNMFWQSEPCFNYFCSGTQVVDTIWSKDVLSEVRRLIPEVNADLQSVQIVSVKEELREEKLKVDDFNVFYFETELPSALFESAIHDYHGEIKVASGMMDELTNTVDSSLMAPVYVTKGGKTIGYFAIPAKYNPGIYLSSFLSVAKKTSIPQVYQTTEFKCEGSYRESSVIDKVDGKDHAFISNITGKTVPYGKKNLCRALLTLRIKASK